MREHQRPSLHSLKPQSPSSSSGLGGHGHCPGVAPPSSQHLSPPSPGHLWPSLARAVGSLQVEPFGMCPPPDSPVPPEPEPNGGDPQLPPTHFKGLEGWLEPLVPDALKLVGGTMTSRVCPCAGGSSLAMRGLPGSGRRGARCFGTSWDHKGHRERQILRGASRPPPNLPPLQS